MSQHDFIFSNRFHHRLARHAAFWFCSYLFFCVVFYIPHGVFPAYNTELFAKNSSRLGFPTWLKWRIFNSSIIFLPELLFAYSIIYFALPRYFFNKKNPLITTLLFAGILMAIFTMNYFGILLVDWNNHRLNPARKIPGFAGRMNFVIRGMLFNYPIMAGFAVIIKMMKRSWLKQQETLQVAREKSKAELQLLKAQIHPHFLFNTLNNIYFLLLTDNRKALEMLRKLTDILRYIIDECSLPLVPMVKELSLIEDYMALEKIRYGDRLKMEVEIKGDYSRTMITPLLLIPLVENSFKHGASKMLGNPWVNLNITIDGHYLIFLLSNSRPDEVSIPWHNGNIGLNNVKKRLLLLYPSAHELSIEKGVRSFEVFMKLNLGESEVIAVEKNETEENLEYAMG